jgi:hypothetical protein
MYASALTLFLSLWERARLVGKSVDSLGELGYRGA